MFGNRSVYGVLIKWSVRLVVLLLIVFALQITVLAYPQIIVRNNVTVGTVGLYYNGTNGEAMSRLAAETDRRLQASPYYDPARINRVFYFDSPGLYSLFARLSFVTTMSQGFELSLFGNSFINGPRIRSLKEKTGGLPKFSIREGNPAHTIAHEIGHQYMIDQIGRSAWKNLPHWKQEGFPEYTANIEAICADSTATLDKRVVILTDRSNWPPGSRWAHIHYEAGLLFEYLLDVKGYTLEDIIADSVTAEKTLEELYDWSMEQANEYP